MDKMKKEQKILFTMQVDDDGPFLWRTSYVVTVSNCMTSQERLREHDDFSTF